MSERHSDLGALLIIFVGDLFSEPLVLKMTSRQLSIVIVLVIRAGENGDPSLKNTSKFITGVLGNGFAGAL